MYKMSTKHDKSLENLTKALREYHITPEIAEPTAGTVIASSLDPSIISKWPQPKQKVPAIFLHAPVDFTQHQEVLLANGIKFGKLYRGRYYTRLTCPTLDDHKALVQYFLKLQLPFNTFGNPSKRKLKVVIRGLPKDIDLNLLKSELISLSIPIIRVHIMQREVYAKNRKSLILAVVPHDDNGKKLLQSKIILGYTVEMEPPLPKVKQCHRCQLWGHTQRYCHGKLKCVKCAGEHITKRCTRDPNKEPPKCANCGGDHTANYRNCPCCPYSKEHKFTQYLKYTSKPVELCITSKIMT